MSLKLNAIEQRVLGCLMEKQVVTPDQYPLTLNALTNACNQKSSRHPVMNLTQGEVQRAIRALEAKHLVRVEENFKSQVEKYTHRVCNTPFSDYQFEPDQYAAMVVLLLRGARTPGEIRANSGRLHTFADNAAVSLTLRDLAAIEGGPLVAELPRSAGRRDAEFVHLWGDEDVPAASTSVPSTSAAPARSVALNLSDSGLADRVAALEVAVARLQAELAELKA